VEIFLFAEEQIVRGGGHRKNNSLKRNFAANRIPVRFSTIESNFKKDIEVRW